MTKRWKMLTVGEQRHTLFAFNNCTSRRNPNKNSQLWEMSTRIQFQKKLEKVRKIWTFGAIEAIECVARPA
jgi:hypothetical protein